MALRAGEDTDGILENVSSIMKTKSVIRLVILMSAVLSVACLIAYRYGSSPTRQRINCVSNLKQIGLSHRMWRNDWSAPFPLRAFDSFAVTNAQPSVTNPSSQR